MILGTIVAAIYDLTFDLEGYAAIMLSNLFTSLNGVVMKKTIQVRAVWGNLSRARAGLD